MHPILLSVFLLMPCEYEDYVSFCILAEIEGVSVEEYIAQEIKGKTGSEEVCVALRAERSIDTYNLFDKA